MLVSHTGLLAGLEQGWLSNAEVKQVNGASIDLRLNNIIQVEANSNVHIVDLVKKQSPRTTEVDLQLDPWVLAPHGWCLGATIERFNLPDNVAAEVKLKSSIARGGLNHMLAGWIDPGFHGALTLEFVNSLQYHPLRLHYAMPIVQVIFYQVDAVPDSASYRTTGRYNGQYGPMASQGVTLDG